MWILELVSECPCSGVGMCCTIMGLGWQMVKEIDLKQLTLGTAERRKTESLPDEESWGGGQRFKSRSDPKSPSLRAWLFLAQAVTAPVRHSSDGRQRPKKKDSKSFQSLNFSP